MSNAIVEPTTVWGHLGNAASSILGAVATTANAADRGVGATAGSIDMFAAFIDTAKAKQRIDHKLELGVYAKTAVLRTAAEQQRTEEAILREMHADKARAAHFDQLHAELLALLA